MGVHVCMSWLCLFAVICKYVFEYWWPNHREAAPILLINYKIQPFYRFCFTTNCRLIYFRYYKILMCTKKSFAMNVTSVSGIRVSGKRSVSNEPFKYASEKTHGCPWMSHHWHWCIHFWPTNETLSSWNS